MAEAHRRSAAGPAGDGSAAPGYPDRKPAWLKVKAPGPRQYRATGALLDELELHTVCREARCPNKGECYAAGTATFLILGDACTRSCRFCAVHQTPGPRSGEESGAARADAGPATPGQGDSARRSTTVCSPDLDEPRRVAEAARRLGLRHVVITSVTRDDLPDGGAGQFVAAIAAVRAALPEATVEVLIPDFGGDEAALGTVLAARPDVLNHNLETVPRLYSAVRPQATYAGSLELLRRAAAWARAAGSCELAAALVREAERARNPASARTTAPPGAQRVPARPLVKSGIMVGLGERAEEVVGVLGDCAGVGVDVATIGQYLRPARRCLPVDRYVHPYEFAAWERRGVALGLRVQAAPFARSSYRAGDVLGDSR